MDYKEKLKAIINSNKTPFVDIDTFLKYFPELKESEDKQMIKSFTRLVKAFYDVNFPTPEGFTREDMIAWLEKQGEHANFRNKIQISDKVTRNEDGVLVNLSQLNRVAKPADKQGEQKPAEWSKEDNKMMKAIIEDIHCGTDFCAEEMQEANKRESWLKSLKERVQPQPKQEWSEEDERMFISLKTLLNSASCYSCTEGADKILSWLKSLKERVQPQNTWKPSDEQMHYLSWIANIKLGDSVVEQEVSKHLNELLEDLKKLSEE